jgi:hypothetical protein
MLTLYFCRLAILIVALSAAAAATSFAQNLVINGDFKQTKLADDIFDGVDKDDFLHVNSEDLPIMIQGSTLSTVLLGASPCWKDLTGDNRPDLKSAPSGYLDISDVVIEKATQ